MPKIHVLPESLANRIAAGEVVERPASVVKELVENAIDAGATRIVVELQEGGCKLIKVSDNGSGMSAEDLLLAVQRFATSKIAEAADLERIMTLGFRGEALPSIGAVAHLRITSRPPEATEGATLTVVGGKIEGPVATGCPPGTIVEVTHLFFNTPARRKFLASTATERGHCIEWVQHLALARPDIAFKVISEGQTLFVTTGQGDVRAVLAAIYGSTAAREFLAVEAQQEDMALQGFISGPRLTRVTRTHQFFFVNQRFVRSRQLSQAVTEAYGLLLPAGKNPLCALYLWLPPSDVDPNVHPTKIEVRFRAPARVYQLCSRACAEALVRAGFRSLSVAPLPASAADINSSAILTPAQTEQLSAGEIERLKRQCAERLRINPFADLVDQRADGLEVFTPPERDKPLKKGFARPLMEEEVAAEEPEVLGQLDGKYIIARLGGDLLIIDQHRAAERVLLHALEHAEGPVARQFLAVPVPIELSPTERAAVEAHSDQLKELGFELEAFGPNAVLLRSIPAALVEKPYEVALRELIEELASWQAPSSAEKRRQQLLALLACHTAIKKGLSLSLAEMQNLINDLLQTEAPAVCPHGDPIIVSLTADQLARRFRR